MDRKYCKKPLVIIPLSESFFNFAKINFIHTKMKRFIVITFALLSTFVSISAQNVIPTMESYSDDENSVYAFPNRPLKLYTHRIAQRAENVLLTDAIGGKVLKKSMKPTTADVVLLYDANCETEAYGIKISRKGIKITASTHNGFVYALQTLRQLRNADDTYNFCTIVDRPRLKYRSFMIDSGRQYHKISTIKRLINICSALKMNYFHWHLTEGQGWRVEIKQYPRLTSVGSSVANGAEQQGFYSQDEIRDVVKFAADRGVTVIPEIDIPGHFEAALKAYPQLGCQNDSVTIPESGLTDQVMCAGKASSWKFVTEVLDEVCNLFPSPYIHLGGDEASKKRWKICPDCQQKIVENHLADENELQLWLSAQMANYLMKKGRTVVFWEDILHTEGVSLPDNIYIQWWNYLRGKETGLKAAMRAGRPVIASTNLHCYLNFPETPWKGYAKNRTFSLQDAYLNNAADKAAADFPDTVVGMETCLWTDYNLIEEQLDERLFPRIYAIAEQMWSRGKRLEFNDFQKLIPSGIFILK